MLSSAQYLDAPIIDMIVRNSQTWEFFFFFLMSKQGTTLLELDGQAVQRCSCDVGKIQPAMIPEVGV